MFNPLDMLRELRDDAQLTSTEKLILICAVLRTDNQTGRVRASQHDLAEDASLTRRTVAKILHGEGVSHYLSLVKVNDRRLDLYWRDHVNQHVNDVHTSCERRSHHLPLSTSTSTTSNASMPMASLGPSLDGPPREPMEDEFTDPEEYRLAHMNWQIENLDWVVAHRDH